MPKFAGRHRWTLLVALMLVVACSDPSTDESQAPSEGAMKTPAPLDTSAPPRDVRRVGTLLRTLRGPGGEGLSAKLTPDDEPMLLGEGDALSAGVVVSTDRASLATLQINSGGKLRLNHSTALRLDDEDPRRAHLERGALDVTLRSREASPWLLTTPYGEVEVKGGSRVVISLSGGRAEVTVARGAAGARSSRGEAPEAGAGQALLLEAEAAPRRVASPDPSAAFGWTEPTLEGQAARGLGTLDAQRPGGGSPKPLRVVRRQIEVRVQGPVATTEVTETFHNPEPATLEGVYRLPLPRGAQLTHLSLKVDGVWQEGVFVETKRTARVRGAVIRDWRDPARLRWSQGGDLELRVFPIPGGASRTLRVGYTQLLQPTPGGLRYTSPMPFDASGAHRVPDFSFTATVDGASAQNLTVEGYPEAELARSSDGGAIEVSLRAEDFSPTGDLGLRLERPGDRAVSHALAYRDPERPDEAGFALMTLRPELPTRPAREARDLILIADTSYGRVGKTEELQARLIHALLTHLDALDRVAVLACDERCQPLGPPGLLPVTTERILAIDSALTALEVARATNPIEALRVAQTLFEARPEGERERSAHVIHLTDGVASAGVTRADDISRAAEALLQDTETRLAMVDLSGDGDPRTLRGLARAGRGSVVHMEPGLTDTEAALRVLSQVDGAVLSDARLTLPEGLTRVYPTSLPPLSAGDLLQVVARAEGEVVEGDVVLEGDGPSGPFSQRFSVSATVSEDPDHAFIPALWASEAIDALTLEGGEVKRDAVIALSLTHGVWSRYTSLRILESEATPRASDLRRREHGEAATSGESVEGRSGQKDAEPVPRVQLKPPRVLGALDRRIIIRDMRSQRTAMQSCYADALKRRPGLEGELQVRFMIDGQGRVPHVKLHKDGLGDDGLARCMMILIKGFRFMKPKGSMVQVTAPFTFALSSPRERSQPAPQGGTPRSRVRFPEEIAAPDTMERVASLRTALERDPDDPDLRLRLVRALELGGALEEAEEVVHAWLERDPFDTTALLLAVEVATRRAQTSEALRHLAAAVESEPQSVALQQRYATALEHDGHPARACAQRLSVESLTSEAPLDPLTCPIASELTGLPQETTPTETEPTAELEADAEAGDARFELSWEGDAELDLVLVDPEGRARSWLSASDHLLARQVRAAKGPELLQVRQLVSGLYQVEIIRRDDGQDPIEITLAAEVAGVSREVTRTLTGRRALALTVVLER